MRIKFSCKRIAKEVLNVSWSLSKETEYSKIYMRNDLNTEEKKYLKTLLQDLRQKNENRTEEKKNLFSRE